MRLVHLQPGWGLLDDIMDDMASNLPSISGQSIKAFVPAMDIYENKNAIIVETPLAGVKPEDVEVSVEKGVLTVKGDSKKEHEVDEKNYYRKEIRSGSFFRQMALPTAVVEEKVKAEFEDGVLKITCPKAQPAKAKKVNINIIKKSKAK
ncbi:MAG: Hsp20/alpha crystallin family protein [bacterium]